MFSYKFAPTTKYTLNNFHFMYLRFLCTMSQYNNNNVQILHFQSVYNEKQNLIVLGDHIFLYTYKISLEIRAKLYFYEATAIFFYSTVLMKPYSYSLRLRIVL